MPQSVIEARQRTTLAAPEVGCDLRLQNLARPTILDGARRVPDTRVPIIEPRHEGDVLAPRQLSNGLLDNFLAASFQRPSLREAPHVMEIRPREARDGRELPTKVGGQSVDDPATPALALLTIEDLVPDLPVEPGELAVDRERGASACSCDPGLDLGQELWVVGRQLLRAMDGVLDHVWGQTPRMVGGDALGHALPLGGRWRRRTDGADAQGSNRTGAEAQ